MSEGVATADSPTPQPPKIDAKPAPTYEPKITGVTTDTDDKQERKPPAATTPQPPKIDVPPEENNAPDTHVEPSEPDDSAAPDETTDATQDDAASKDKTGNEETPLWLDTHPKRVSADWLQLTSGEWLRGHVISMQKNRLEFDSDELKNLDIEWKKVKYLISHEPFSLRFDNQVTAIGAIEITHDKVYVNTDYDDQEFDRSSLLIIASGRDTELSHWSSKISLSLNIRKGNTEQTDFNTRLNAKRRTLLSRLVVDYLANYTKVKETETINNQRLNAIYDIFITRSFFWTLVAAEYYRDPFQNIARRVNAYTAFGYALIDNNETEWDVSAGPGYQETKYVSVQSGSEKDTAFILMLNTRFETELNSRIDLEGTYTATLGDHRTGSYTHHSLLTIETEITDRLDFDVTVTWDRTQKPVPDENNSSPERDDLRFLIGIGYEL
jgi:hypothetical protein